MARPATVWLVRNVMQRNACRSDVSAPAAMPMRIERSTVNQAEPPMCCDAQAPVTAPMSMVPSTPRFSTPLRSVNTPPKAAKKSGVP